ncbi:MAG: patatin-like phospholipase family protein [Alphaproteobacteria bacterium]|nr:patatin-like phospholipase family protein [Alphaproteobacteria bacterium]
MNDGAVAAGDLAQWFPKLRPAATDERPDGGVFEIGLCCAGAISAGAYAAGVFDFLVEALDAWHAAKANGEAVPRHQVQLRIVTGASAGGMNAAILAASAPYRFPAAGPRATAGDRARNPFYRAWVDEIDIAKLLATDDLERDGFRSLLNSIPLRRIAADIVEHGPASGLAAIARPWLLDPLPVLLTVTNLRGVPYAVAFKGGSPHGMRIHADTLGFMARSAEASAGAVPPDAIDLPFARSASDPRWGALVQAALATGAFPVALRPGEILRPAADYKYRFAQYLPGEAAPSFISPDGTLPDPYAFPCVDGGLINNEPFEMARTALAGLDGRNERDGAKARRAVIMLDPFVEAPGEGPAELGPSIARIAVAMFTALKDQARFKPESLLLAMREDVFSRFLIAPKRYPDGAARGGAAVEGVEAMASGGLGGFLGFFSREYRHHDFMLGRSNCQAFLRNVFALPESNTVFDAETRASRKWRCRDDPKFVPIVPLVGALAEDEYPSPWPRGAFTGWPAVETAFTRRADAAAKALIATWIGRDGAGAWAKRKALEAAWGIWGRGWVRDKVQARLDDARDAVDRRAL